MISKKIVVCFSIISKSGHQYCQIFKIIYSEIIYSKSRKLRSKLTFHIKLIGATDVVTYSKDDPLTFLRHFYLKKFSIRFTINIFEINFQAIQH